MSTYLPLFAALAWGRNNNPDFALAAATSLPGISPVARFAVAAQSAQDRQIRDRAEQERQVKTGQQLATFITQQNAQIDPDEYPELHRLVQAASRVAQGQPVPGTTVQITLPRNVLSLLEQYIQNQQQGGKANAKRGKAGGKVIGIGRGKGKPSGRAA